MSKHKKNPEQVFYLCMGKKCKKDNKEHLDFLKNFIKKEELKDRVELVKTECTGRCKQAPVVCVQPQNEWLEEADETALKKIIHS